VAALGRLMSNVQGPSVCRRRLFMSVAQSKLLYASPVWELTAAKTARNSACPIQTQRGAAIRIARCYRTVSNMAALVLARIPPAHILARERFWIEECRCEVTMLGRSGRFHCVSAKSYGTNRWKQCGRGRWSQKSEGG